MGTCSRCGGKGQRVYASTAVWRGGIGGAMMTPGTCDLCWGSGDEAKPGEDLRLKEYRERELWMDRYRHDAAFRWKERARRFARRYRNTHHNYREAQREIQRWYKESQRLEVQLAAERSKVEQLRAALHEAQQLQLVAR